MEELDAKRRKPSLISGRKPSPKIYTVVAGHAETQNVCGEMVRPHPLHVANLAEADIRQGRPSGRTHKSVKEPQGFRLGSRSEIQKGGVRCYFAESAGLPSSPGFDVGDVCHSVSIDRIPRRTGKSRHMAVWDRAEPRQQVALPGEARR